MQNNSWNLGMFCANCTKCMYKAMEIGQLYTKMDYFCKKLYAYGVMIFLYITLTHYEHHADLPH